MSNGSDKTLRDVKNRRSLLLQSIVRYLAALLILLISTVHSHAVADTEIRAADEPGISRSHFTHTPTPGPSASDAMTPAPPQKTLLEEALPEFIGAVGAALFVAVLSYLLNKAVVYYRRRQQSQPPQDTAAS
ncbi:hypothetical protein [Streptomyces sp. NPDC001652]|uniref:hypothetical protein n=1 Tax=Streptomyces sp. NPDC001652 TaxID=3154393 RepID=UPI003329B7FA